MRIKYLIFLCILMDFYNLFARMHYSKDYMEMHAITKAIGPGDGRTLYFIRSNGVISLDSIYPIIKDIFKNDFDSLRYDCLTKVSFHAFSSNEHDFKCHSIMLFLTKPFYHKHYSLNVFVDTTMDIIAVSSLKWQLGFIEPPSSNNNFSRKVKDKIISKFPYSEYIGCTKMEYEIIEANKIWPFWHQPEVPFWKWFKNYEEYLYNYEMRKEFIDKNISRKLYDIEYDLTFEIGPIINNKREFKIIGPETMREIMLNNIPYLKHWYISYFTNAEQNKRNGAQEEK